MTMRGQLCTKETNKDQRGPQMTRKDQLRPIGSRLFGQNWLTRLAAVPAGMVFMGGRRTGGYSLEDYSGTRLQMRTFPTLKCIMFNSVLFTTENWRSEIGMDCLREEIQCI